MVLNRAGLVSRIAGSVVKTLRVVNCSVFPIRYVAISPLHPSHLSCYYPMIAFVLSTTPFDIV